jgi:FixJ family two-component response regulator
VENLRRTVAVVDDDASLRRSVTRLLNADGFDVAVYASAEAVPTQDAGIDGACPVLDIDLNEGTSRMELLHRLRRRFGRADHFGHGAR